MLCLTQAHCPHSRQARMGGHTLLRRIAMHMTVGRNHSTMNTWASYPTYINFIWKPSGQRASWAVLEWYRLFAIWPLLGGQHQSIINSIRAESGWRTCGMQTCRFNYILADISTIHSSGNSWLGSRWKRARCTGARLDRPTPRTLLMNNQCPIDWSLSTYSWSFSSAPN